nr:hypothetical protein [Paenibacillus xylanexedens]
MTNGWGVTAQNIISWSENNQRRSQETITLLVKKLILASSKPESLSFPSGDSVLVGGWDGFLKVGEGNQYVPDGTSVWEFGTTSRVGTKANEDYKKRTKNSLGLEKSDTTFVFVTTRTWLGRDKWVKEKQEEGHWGHIVGLNADDLASWLELCPAVHNWFARLLDKRPLGSWDIDQAWTNWSCMTELNTTAKLVIAGRRAECNKIIELLAERPSVIRISSDSRDESYAFALAAIKENENYSSRFMAVLDPDAWDVLVQNDSPLILLPYFQESRTFAAAVTRGHWVVIPEVGLRSSGSKIIISLNKADRDLQKDAIVEMGLEDELATRVVDSCRGNLRAIRRHQALVPLELQTPPWTDQQNLIQPAVTILLAGTWDASNGADCEIISELAGIPYSEFEQHCNSLALTDDPPIRRIGDTWNCISRQDAWTILAQYIDKAKIELFSKVTKDVLSEMDPRYELPLKETWIAKTVGKKLSFSEELRRGLAEMINLLAVYGDTDCRNVGQITVQDRMSYLVRQLLIEEMSSARWYSLRGHLTLLAEAAPTIFLEAIEKDLKTENPTITGLFKESFMIGASQANLLWALEIISWNLEYLSRTVRVLAKLDVLDPGGNYTNRPINSLREIFLGWSPQTNASLSIRLQVIDTLIRLEKETAWKLLILLLPAPGGISSPIAKPKQRQWDARWNQKVSMSDRERHIEEITKRVLQHTNQDHKRWIQVIDKISNLPHHCIELVLFEFEKVELANFSSVAQIEISEKLRALISRHRQYPESDWALREQFLIRLEVILEKSQPADIVLSYVYLYNEHYPSLLNPDPKRDFDKTRERVEILRIDALEMIWTSEGWEGIIRLVEHSSLPHIIGTVLAKTSFSHEVEDEILEHLTLLENGLAQCAHSFSSHRSYTLDGWVSKLMKTKKDSWDDEKWIAFCLTLEFGSETFSILEQMDEKVSEGYWSRVSNFYLPEKDAERVEWIIKRLLKSKRPLSVINAIHLFLRKFGARISLPSELIADVLEMVASSKDATENKVYFSHITYEIMEIFKLLQDSGELSDERMVRLEWMYLSLFEQYQIRPQILLKSILSEPAMFIQIIRMLYRANPEIENEDEGVPPEAIKNMARVSYELLKMISTIPGQDGNNIDRVLLEDWIKEVRKMANECHRSMVVDNEIGGIFAYSPNGVDGRWPHEAVRDILESLENDVVERGLILELFNQRGVVTRSFSEGGRQERELAANYDDQASDFQFIWPRTAAVLKQISQGYVRDAAWEDNRAELRDF